MHILMPKKESKGVAVGTEKIPSICQCQRASSSNTFKLQQEAVFHFEQADLLDD